MSTVLHPVGPRSPRVYWRRRLVALALVVALVVAVAVALSALGRARADGAADGGTGAEADGAAVAGDAVADDAPDDAGTGADDGAAPVVPVACEPAALALTLASDGITYPAGSAPAFTLGVTNTGADACTVDLGGAEHEVVVVSGADRIWSSVDCAGEPEERLLLLEAGAREETVVAWDRTRSAPECPADLPEPRAGTYSATATLLGASSAAAVFDLG